MDKGWNVWMMIGVMVGLFFAFGCMSDSMDIEVDEFVCCSGLSSGT